MVLVSIIGSISKLATKSNHTKRYARRGICSCKTRAVVINIDVSSKQSRHWTHHMVNMKGRFPRTTLRRNFYCS